MTGALRTAQAHVLAFADSFTATLGPLGISIGVAAAGVVAMTAAVTNLGSRGSDIDDLSSSLDQFAGSGENATGIMASMAAGTLHTVDNFTLMQTATTLLAKGVVTTADDFGTLTAAAFELQNRGFGPTKDILGQLERALVTGKTATLSNMGVQVDATLAAQDYANAHNQTVDSLTKAERISAVAAATMEALTKVSQGAGKGQRDFGEQIEAATTFVRNFIDKLAQAVSGSPAVQRAMDAIGDALAKAFGGDSEHAIDTIMRAIDGFADSVATWGPVVIRAFVSIKDAIVNVVTTITTTWASLPDWLKFFADDAVKAAGAIWLVSGAITALAGSTALTTLIGLLGTVFNTVRVLGFVGAIQYAMAPLTTYIGATLAAATAQGGLTATIAATTAVAAPWIIAIAAIAAALGVVYNAVMLAWEAIDRHNAQKRQDAVDTSNLARINKALGTSFTDLGDATAAALKKARESGPPLSQVLDGLGNSSLSVNDRVMALNASLLKTAERGELNTKTMDQAIKAIRASGIAYDDLSASSKALIDADNTRLALQKEHVKASDDAQAAIVRQKKATDDAAGAMKSGADKIAAYHAGLVRLTPVQEAAAKALEKMGLSADEIAKQMHVATGSVQNYFDGLKPLSPEHVRLANTMAAFGRSAAYIADELDVATGSVERHFRALETVRASWAYEIGELESGTVSIEQASRSIGGLTQAMGTLGHSITTTDASRIGIPIAYAKEQAKEADKTLSDLADGFVRLGQAAGGSLGGIISAMGQIIVMSDNANKAGQKFGGHWGQGSVMFSDFSSNAEKAGAGLQIATAAMAGFGQMQDALQQKSRGGRALGGMQAGATVGSAFGPWGAAIGAGVGALVGLFSGDPKWVKAQQTISEQFGVAVSDELGKAIAATAKDFKGAVLPASLMHLKDIISEAGGITTANLDKMTTQFGSLFGMIDTGQLTVAQGSKILDDNWGAFVEAGTSKYGLLNAQLVEVIKNNEKVGTGSKAIADYLGQQGAAGASAFGAYLQVGAQAILKQQELGGAIQGANGELTAQQAIIDATTIKTQAAADAMAYAVMADFDAMLQAGMSFSGAVEAIQPAIDGLAVQMQAAGLQGSEAFGLLNAQVALYSDEVAGPALSAVDALTQGMVTLDNMGKMNNDTFLALSGQVTQTFDALVAQGQNGDAVLLAMRDSVQRLWEEQQQFGYVTDAATQALIDEAVQQGIVGETHKSISEQMLDASNKMVDVLGAIATALGATIPNAAATGATGVQRALNEIRAPDLTVRINYDESGKPEASYASTGGLVTAHGVVQYLAGGGNVLPFAPRGTDTVPAMLTPGERVLSVSQNQTYENYIEGPSNQEVVDAVNGLRTDMSTKLPRALARSLHTGLVGLRTAS